MRAFSARLILSFVWVFIFSIFGLADSETVETQVAVQSTYVLFVYDTDGNRIENNELSFEVDLQQPEMPEITLNIHAITNFDVLVRLEHVESVKPNSLMLTTTASGKANTQPIENIHFPESLGQPLSLLASLSGQNNADGEGETIIIQFSLDPKMTQDAEGKATYTVTFEVVEL